MAKKPAAPPAPSYDAGLRRWTCSAARLRSGDDLSLLVAVQTGPERWTVSHETRSADRSERSVRALAVFTTERGALADLARRAAAKNPRKVTAAEAGIEAPGVASPHR